MGVYARHRKADAEARPRGSPVCPRNKVEFAARLRQAGVDVEARHYPALDHGRMVLALSRMFRDRAPMPAQMTGFLQRYAG
ncbi:hypothetical protein [Phenylobacterium sp.]|uniref:hypothetical protein n=1 Tax=Phenylobacterium sp. TaxID=1871053 RepID=UPI00286A12F0|nr:hypothetical protein [Phenylobacterium sp.]